MLDTIFKNGSGRKQNQDELRFVIEGEPLPEGTVVQE
jgi:hypothetical protein